MADEAKLKALEQSLGGPNGSPLLIGCEEPAADIAAAMECLEPDVEYRICVRLFQGADTYIITARPPSANELRDLESLMDDGAGDEDEGEGDSEPPESDEGEGSEDDE